MDYLSPEKETSHEGRHFEMIWEDMQRVTLDSDGHGPVITQLNFLPPAILVKVFRNRFSSERRECGF